MQSAFRRVRIKRGIGLVVAAIAVFALHPFGAQAATTVTTSPNGTITSTTTSPGGSVTTMTKAPDGTVSSTTTGSFILTPSSSNNDGGVTPDVPNGCHSSATIVAYSNDPIVTGDASVGCIQELNLAVQACVQELVGFAWVTISGSCTRNPASGTSYTFGLTAGDGSACAFEDEYQTQGWWYAPGYSPNSGTFDSGPVFCFGA
jgi:hypothetical protein